MAWLITTDDQMREVLPANGSAFTLEEMQSYVGGYIELVRIASNEFLVVNEDGLQLGLSTNERATLIGRRAGVFMAQPGIVGNVLRCDSKEVR